MPDLYDANTLRLEEQAAKFGRLLSNSMAMGERAKIVVALLKAMEDEAHNRPAFAKQVLGKVELALVKRINQEHW